MGASMQIITWMELAISAVTTSWSTDNNVVDICPIDMSKGDARWAIRQNQRWLCDSDGKLTLFDSLEAVRRFLHLLKVEQFNLAGRFEGGTRDRLLDPDYCYRLARGRLMACKDDDSDRARVSVPAFWLKTDGLAARYAGSL